MAIAAPTVRAAKRITEVTGREAKTIHRLLEVEWGINDQPIFQRNDRNPLDCDALIVDELSMTDVQLFRVDNVTSTIILQNTIQTIHGPMELYTSAWKMKELCFDPSTQQLLLLHDAATQVVQTVESTVFKYDIPNINSGWVGASYSPHVVIDKIDAATNNGYWTIGEENYGLEFSRETLVAAATCRQDYNLSYIFSAGAVNIAPFMLVLANNSIIEKTISATIHHPFFSINCTE